MIDFDDLDEEGNIKPASERAAARTGNAISDKLLDAAGITVDRLPMLHVIFDRVATYCADGLRHMSASPSYFSVSNIESGRIGDILEFYESNAIAAMFHATEWDTRILVGFDRDFIFTMVEVLFGSDGTEPPVDEERGFSNIETRVAQTLFEEAGKALATAFGPVARTGFRLERNGNAQWTSPLSGGATISRVVAKLLIQALGRGGEGCSSIDSPIGPVRRMRQSLAACALRRRRRRRSALDAADAGGGASAPGSRSRQSSEERMITLGDVAQFQVGQGCWNCRASPKSPVRLQCNGQALFSMRARPVKRRPIR